MTFQFGLDAKVNSTISTIHSKSGRLRLSNDLTIVPGAFFSIDPTGRLGGYCSTGGPSLLSVKYKVYSPLQWVALHLDIGGIDLQDASLFGLVCKSRAPEATTLQACLRSHTHIGTIDAFLPKHIVCFGDVSTHLDTLRLHDHVNVPMQADGRELIIFFPKLSTAIELIDLRIILM